MKKKKEERVSVWVGFDKGDPDVDILKDLCGVKYYDVDFQDIIIDDKKWRQRPIKSLLSQLSYSGSFLAEAMAAAKAKSITKALYVVAQYRFVYDPKKVTKKIAADPIFLGCFAWNDDESKERIQKYLDAMKGE